MCFRCAHACYIRSLCHQPHVDVLQATGAKILGAFDGNPAGHVIAMLYKFGSNREDVRELSAPNLKVVALFPSDLQREGCPFWQTPFNDRDTQCVVSSIQRLERLQTCFNDTGNAVLAAECAVWVQEMKLWQNEHSFTAELDSLTRIYSWDTVILFWLGAEQQHEVEGS
jgi:DNA topoisomerase VI subunit A